MNGLRLVGIDGDKNDVIRGNTRWSDNPFVVMVLFNRRAHKARYANAIAAHEHCEGLTVSIEYGGFHRRAVFVPELKDMADLDPSANLDCAVIVRCRFSDFNVAEVGDFVEIGVSVPINVAKMLVVLIGPASEVFDDAG